MSVSLNWVSYCELKLKIYSYVFKKVKHHYIFKYLQTHFFSGILSCKNSKKAILYVALNLTEIYFNKKSLQISREILIPISIYKDSDMK